MESFTGSGLDDPFLALTLTLKGTRNETPMPYRPRKNRKRQTPPAPTRGTVNLDRLKAALLEEFLVYFHRVKAELDSERGSGYSHAHPNAFIDRMNRLILADPSLGALQIALHRLGAWDDVAKAFSGKFSGQVQRN